MMIEEIMSARTHQVDHDLAFNLQMKEAIEASLALNPPSSSSSSRHGLKCRLQEEIELPQQLEDREMNCQILDQKTYRTEIMSARTHQYDHDLVFNLQMKEAIEASLALKPPSSSSSPRHGLKRRHQEELELPQQLEDREMNCQIHDQKTYRTEIMSARTHQYDHDLEFELQMKEAIEASLALKPTSSSSSSRHGIKRRRQEEIELPQQLKDREMNCQIHDQRYGDEYNSRPYGECSQSTARVDEKFWVCIKGLVSEEQVRDSMVMVAAIGVAIYDSKDKLIFEVSKPLLDVDKRSSTSHVEVGFEALIEGLNAAIALDLRRVTCYCDDDMVDQYIRRVLPPPKPLKLANLLTDAIHLKRKFTKFRLSLVEQNDIELAFKLARDAIVSQITWTSGRGKNLMETCVICLEDTAVNKMFMLDGCLHRFCFSCMKQDVKVKLLNGMMAKCIHHDCKFEVNIDRCREFLDPKSIEIMRQRIEEASIPVTRRVYCPNPRCSALMSKREVLEYTNKYYKFGGRYSGKRKCTKCRGSFCINCKVPWHYKMTCDGYKRSNLYQSAEDAKLKSLARKKLWRECVKCNHMVELGQGCYHIRCRCGNEFCYTCGAEWKNKKATCMCPLWAEEYIMDDDEGDDEDDEDYHDDDEGNDDDDVGDDDDDEGDDDDGFDEEYYDSDSHYDDYF